MAEKPFRISAARLKVRDVMTSKLRAQMEALDAAVGDYNRRVPQLHKKVADAIEAVNGTLYGMTQWTYRVGEDMRDAFESRDEDWLASDEATELDERIDAALAIEEQSIDTLWHEPEEIEIDEEIDIDVLMEIPTEFS